MHWLWMHLFKEIYNEDILISFLYTMNDNACNNYSHIQGYLTLVMMGGGALCAPQSVFIFLLKISPSDQTLRPTCKFLILGISYHEIFFYRKFSI